MIIIELNNCKVPDCVASGETSHRWEWERPTIQELLRVQETTGMDPDQWQDALAQALEKFSTEAMKATIMLVGVLHRRIGIVVGFEEIDFDVFALKFLPDPEAEVEAEDDLGKGETPTSRPLGDGDPTSSTSGASPKAGSGRKSSPTPQTSGAPSG